MSTDSSHNGLDASKNDQNTLEPASKLPYTFTNDFHFLPIPKRLRYHPGRPFHCGLALNIYFSLAVTFVVGNLFYCQPLLIELAKSFNVTYNEVSRIPTLLQAGYAAGLLLICPLGDLVRRRPLLLLLVFLSSSFTIGLAVTSSHVMFEALCFFVAAVSVIPPILLSLAVDLTPENRHATVISIILSGVMFGVLLVRVIAGVITEFSTWRVVYYIAAGLQFLVSLGLYVTLPDIPCKNSGLTYRDILWSMAKLSVTEPLLIQSSLINILSSACFSNFWVTLTFLLGGSPYNYSTLDIGLFGLTGLFGFAMGPLLGRAIDFVVPWYASFLSTIGLMVSQTIQVGAGGIHIAAVIVSIMGSDVFKQMQQISLMTSVLSISASARTRLNALLVFSMFVGQVIGTPIGTAVFVKYGWRAGAALSIGWYGLQMVLLIIRGPQCKRFTWFGWEGGAGSLIKKLTTDKDGTDRCGQGIEKGVVEEHSTNRRTGDMPESANTLSKR
ncbi:hypothetical protein AMATHDRAFT_148912 [Amanita thiersii Skay4041]|uniref:Major facilitator superfamily (MFS) profile domain-containing protein n=1 Tax=Amanita thiersii Skay4041 TaxID=703135 RepID=A0A2A9NE40_9AGAR|nr:hypothetical protein AMATHDRAFT_148912 [Amanita thiersii Skay4041]